MTEVTNQPSGDLSLPELLASVREFLANDVVPQLEGRSQFNTRVANGVLGTVVRELASAEAMASLQQVARTQWGLAQEVDPAQALAKGLAERSVTVDDALLAWLRQYQLLVCQVNNPKYPSLAQAQQRWVEGADN